MPLILILAGIGLFVISTALKAMAVAFDGNDFPEALAIKLEALPVIFPVHMLTGGLSLLLVPLAIFMRRTRWHKIAGRVAAADVLIAGVTAIPVALTYPVTPMAGAGFAMQGVVWLALLAIGIWNIRRGRVAQHRAAMLMMAAVTSGAVFFRIYLALWALYGSRRHFDTFYACDAWMGWVLPLGAVAAWLWLGRRRPVVKSRLAPG
ncbi:DUF2306 domain-containing protein [Aestuariivirga litoralis]|uniref:DUF2306 domain-containing protein n=1 Tax=Aestuariivirga litoralis TaxID=2650924 RepID=UPI0018C78259